MRTKTKTLELYHVNDTTFDTAQRMVGAMGMCERKCTCCCTVLLDDDGVRKGISEVVFRVERPGG